MANPYELRKRFKNLVAAKTPWYKIVNQSGGPSQIMIYDMIGGFGVNPEDFVADLAKIDGPVDLHLSSEGGEIFAGKTIYNALAGRDSLSVYVDSLAASAAAFIAMAASPGRLYMSKVASMMIHDGLAMALGSPAELRAMIDVLERESDTIASIYADRAGKTIGYFREKMRAETWYNAQEALAEGLCDYVFDPRTREMSNKLAGAAAGNAGGAAGNAGWVQRDGKWVFDPDGDGDDDSSAETDTDHNYWSADGKQLKAIPPNPATGQGGKPLPPANRQGTEFWNEKYSADDRKKMASSGAAMPDGSYPIADEEDLNRAIKAVGRGGADHDAIRRHVIKRAKALGKSGAIPDNWNPDGSLGSSAPSSLSTLLITGLKGA